MSFRTPGIGGSPCHVERLRRCGLRIFGSVGVIGINSGGLCAGRRACFANASTTWSFDTIGGNAVALDCLKGRARMLSIIPRAMKLDFEIRFQMGTNQCSVPCNQLFERLGNNRRINRV